MTSEPAKAKAKAPEPFFCCYSKLIPAKWAEQDQQLPYFIRFSGSPVRVTYVEYADIDRWPVIVFEDPETGRELYRSTCKKAFEPELYFLAFRIFADFMFTGIVSNVSDTSSLPANLL
jgi:hypothetical protein